MSAGSVVGGNWYEEVVAGKVWEEGHTVLNVCLWMLCNSSR
jgi:hypothetical protein